MKKKHILIQSFHYILHENSTQTFYLFVVISSKWINLSLNWARWRGKWVKVMAWRGREMDAMSSERNLKLWENSSKLWSENEELIQKGIVNFVIRQSYMKKIILKKWNIREQWNIDTKRYKTQQNLKNLNFCWKNPKHCLMKALKHQQKK